jgi:endonuclease/exonuclease/phosphatase family metal-dependent hydrolase
MPIPPSGSGNFADAIKGLGSDVAGFQEVDHHLARSGNEPQMHIAAQSLGAKYWAFAPSVIGTPGEVRRHLNGSDEKIISNGSMNNVGSYGIGIVSRIPVIKWERLELGRSLVGLPLLIPAEKGVKAIYVNDEERVALAAHLDNGWIVINTHLSFVPFVNLYQLGKVKQWAKKLSEGGKYKVLIIGDLNLPKNLSGWNSLITQKSYPSWGAKVQFDYILSNTLDANQIEVLPTSLTGVSDHLPISVRINT